MNEIILDNTSLPVVCGCDRLAASEGFYHADRVTDFNVLIYVTDGVIYVTEGETDYEVKKGELLFLKSGIRHFGKYEIPRGTRWFFLHFISSADITSDEFVPDREPMEQYMPYRRKITLPKKLSGLIGSNTEAAISAFADYYSSDEPAKKWDINSRAFSLLTKIAFYSGENDVRESLSDRISRYISDHYTEQFSAKNLEKEMFLSYKHLASVFKREKGITMQQLHTELRMNEASRLLRSTLLPVGDIALRVGYSDMLYFSRRFHEYFGISPTEYRRRPPVY